MANDFLTIIRRQKAQVNAVDADNLQRVIDAYTHIYSGLQGDIDALQLAIEAIDNPTVAEVQRLPQYKRLLRDTQEELDRFTAFLEVAIGAAAVAAIGLGLSHSSELVNLASSGFQGLNTNSVKTLLDYLAKDSPLYDRLKFLTGSAVDRVVQSILDGVGQGWNPRKIASAIQDAFGGGLTDALRNTRTVQMWSYRDAARANYMASDGVVTGWVWWAELDADTCEACVAEHGTVHDLTEQLDGHYNCRCAELPYIEGVTPDVTSGEDWFNGLSGDEQRGLLGPGKFDAWQAGKFDFGQLSKQVPNDVYGTMRVPSTLQDLTGE